MNKYDIISDYCKFECEPGVFIAVDCVSTGQQDLDEKNARVVEGKWKAIWPATFEFLKVLRKEYDFDTDFTPAGMRVKLMLADTVMSEGADWEVSFTIIDDGYSGELSLVDGSQKYCTFGSRLRESGARDDDVANSSLESEPDARPISSR